MNEGTVINIVDLHASYEHSQALTGVDLEVKDKEFLGIVGPNGGGKTTLVKSILGLIKPDQGKVEVDEKAVIGYVPQLTTFDRSFPITVEDVILTGHLPKKMRWHKSFSEHEKKHCTKIMQRLGIDGLKDRQIGALSGGQMQRVLIARALMNHPTVLILDEPTAGVDQQSKREVYNMLKELNKNMTIVMITHDTSVLMGFIDRIIYINKKAHIHNIPLERKEDQECCPIEWFMQGEEIQKELMEGNKDD